MGDIFINLFRVCHLTPTRHGAAAAPASEFTRMRAHRVRCRTVYLRPAGAIIALDVVLNAYRIDRHSFHVRCDHCAQCGRAVPRPCVCSVDRHTQSYYNIQISHR